MIEVTFVEIALFVWAILATGAWFKEREHARRADTFIHAILEDDELRDSLVADYKRKDA